MLATLGSILAALFFFAIYRVVKGHNNVPWPARPILLFLATTSLAVAPPVVEGLGKIANMLDGLGGLSAAGSATLTIVVLLVILILDLRDKKPDGGAKTAIVLIPLLGVIASGPVGDAVRSVNDGVSDVGEGVITTVSE